jgi:hypothetical protein
MQRVAQTTQQYSQQLLLVYLPVLQVLVLLQLRQQSLQTKIMKDVVVTNPSPQKDHLSSGKMILYISVSADSNCF